MNSFWPCLSGWLFQPSTKRFVYPSWALYLMPLKSTLPAKCLGPWVNVLLEIIEESILLPLYFCLGNSLNDIKETKNKVKTGILVATLVYFAFSAATSALAWPLIKIMGQNETLHEVTVDYIRIELISIVFGSLSKILMVVFVMLEWNGMLYLILIIQH